MRPHGPQPTRLLHPLDSPGKNTGVGCHFLLQCMKVESESEVAQSCPTLSDPMDCSLPGSSIHGIFRATVLEWGAIDILFLKISTYYFHDIHRERLKEKIFDIVTVLSYIKTIQTIDLMTTDHRRASTSAWNIFTEFFNML